MIGGCFGAQSRAGSSCPCKCVVLLANFARLAAAAFFLITSFTVQAAAQRPSAPSLTAPLNGATNVSTTQTFTWTAVSDGGAQGNYRIQIARNAADLSADPDSLACGASCVVTIDVTGSTSYTPPA